MLARRHSVSLLIKVFLFTWLPIRGQKCQLRLVRPECTGTVWSDSSSLDQDVGEVCSNTSLQISLVIPLVAPPKFFSLCRLAAASGCHVSVKCARW